MSNSNWNDGGKKPERLPLDTFKNWAKVAESRDAAAADASPANGPGNYELAQRYAIALNEEERFRFAAWFAEWHYAVTPAEK